MLTFDELFAGQTLMTILRGQTVERTVELAEMSWDLGIGVVEVTVQSAQALDALREVVILGGSRGLVVGAGTIVDTATMRSAMDAGAGFTVSPAFDRALVDIHRAEGVPHLPGIATPSELQQAVSAGCDWVKVFPAAALGHAWFRAIKGPFPEIKMVATGGIGVGEATSYISSGADVVGLGSSMADPGSRSELERLRAGS